jgi:glycosyltransferase involved in cell wall biosynthesis
MRTAVVIPTLNEEASIAGVVRALPRALIDHIIVADGGSRDATVGRARDAGAEVIAAGRGYGRACLAGVEAASDADIIVFMDGDGADDPASLGALVEPIRAGEFDFVIASRARGAREPGSIGWHQLLAGRLAGLGTRLLYGVRYTDMCAFRAIRRDRLLALGMREMTYGWNIEMQMRAARARLRILEIPVPYHRRAGGESKVAGSLGGTLRASSRIIATFVRVATQSGARVPSPPSGGEGRGEGASPRVIAERVLRGESAPLTPTLSPQVPGEGAQAHEQVTMQERDA